MGARARTLAPNPEDTHHPPTHKRTLGQSPSEKSGGGATTASELHKQSESSRATGTAPLRSHGILHRSSQHVHKEGAVPQATQLFRKVAAMVPKAIDPGNAVETSISSVSGRLAALVPLMRFLRLKHQKRLEPILLLGLFA